MDKVKIFPALTWASLMLFCVLGGRAALAQGDSSTKRSDVAPNYTEQQWRGEGLFLQRCSICHLAKKIKNVGSPPTVGPDLTGVFAKDTSPEQEKSLRQFILKGSPNMPGFQYGLSAKDIDNLIAYLKTKNQ